MSRGCGATIQRTADAAGLVWRKIFLKEGENRKIGVREVPEGGLRVPYIGRAGDF